VRVAAGEERRKPERQAGGCRHSLPQCTARGAPLTEPASQPLRAIVAYKPAVCLPLSACLLQISTNRLNYARRARASRRRLRVLEDPKSRSVHHRLSCSIHRSVLTGLNSFLLVCCCPMPVRREHRNSVYSCMRARR